MGGNFGTGFSRGIGNTGQVMAGQMMNYHKEHVGRLQQEGALQELSNYAVNPSGNLVRFDPNSPNKDKNLIPFIQPKALELAQANARDATQRAVGARDVATKIGMRQVVEAMTNPKIPVRIPGIGDVNLSPGDAARYSTAQQRANRPASTRTTNPDLNFTHAVNAHEKQLGGLDESLYQNYGVHPIDILQSDRHIGFTFDKNKGYINTPEGKQPDAISINTGEGPKFFSKDQFEALKKPAEDWQALQQNPPKREDYQQQTPAATGGDVVAQANQIKAAYQAGSITREQAASQIKALSIPGLQ